MKGVATALVRVLAGLGVLLLAAAAGGAFLLQSGRLPKERLDAAVAALKGKPADAPAPKPALPEGPEFIVEARAKLNADLQTLEEERALARTQLAAERAEIEVLKGEVDAKLAELARPRPETEPAAPGATGTSAAGAPAPSSEKGLKAVAEMLGKMDAKGAAQLLGGQTDADAARILRRMDAKQAGKVMTALVSADAVRAGRITSILREMPQ